MKIVKIEKIAWNLLRLFLASKKAKATVDISDPADHEGYNVGDDFDSLAHADDESEEEANGEEKASPAKKTRKRTKAA